MTVVSPLTRTAEVTLVETIPASRLIAGWRAGYGIDITDELKGHREIRLYRCDRSGLLFFSPPDVAGSPRLYELLQRGDRYYMPPQWEHDVAVEDLPRFGKILEVGCGQGEFIEKLLRSPGPEVRGIDMNPAAVAHAQRKGLPIALASGDAPGGEPPGSWDAVCAFQVLEHVPDTRGFLASLVRLLRPGGRLILSVPNADSFIRHDGNNLLDMPPHHMTRWCPDALRAIAALFPVRIVRFRFEPLAEYHIDWYGAIQASRVRSVPLLGAAASLADRRVLRGALRRSRALRRMITGHTIYACFEKAADGGTGAAMKAGEDGRGAVDAVA